MARAVGLNPMLILLRPISLCAAELDRTEQRSVNNGGIFGRRAASFLDAYIR